MMMVIKENYPELAKELERIGVMEDISLTNQIILALSIAFSNGKEAGRQEGIEEAIETLQSKI
jgi:hypothetical protein